MNDDTLQCSICNEPIEEDPVRCEDCDVIACEYCVPEVPYEGWRCGCKSPLDQLIAITKKIRAFGSKLADVLTLWVEHGSPIIPEYKINTRSPHFVLLVISIAVFALYAPEVLWMLTQPLY